MALDAPRLAAAMRAAILANVTGATDNAAMTALCTAIAESVVDEITGNAEAVIAVTAAGLQTTTALGSPTAPPAPTEKTLPIR